MATTIPADGAYDRQYAVVFGLYPGDPTFFTYVERAPEVGGNPGTGVFVGLLSPGSRYFVDRLSPTGDFYYYRFYHTGRGYALSENPTAWYRARPVEWNGILPPIPREALLDLDLALDSTDGTVDIVANGSPKVASIKWASDTTGYPASGTGTAVNTDSSGDVTVTDAFTLTAGQTGYVRATYYDGPDGTGNILGTLRDSVTYTSVSPNDIPCPNLAGSDAPYIQGGGDYATGTVEEYVYDQVSIGKTGLQVGDPVSFCANMWVGSDSQTEPVEADTTGKLGLVSSGVLWNMRHDVSPNSIGSRYVNPSRPWLVRDGVGGTLVQKQGLWVFEFDVRENRFDSLIFNPPGASSYDIWSGYANGILGGCYLQAFYQHEGVASPLAGGSNNISLYESVGGRNYKAQNYYTTQPTAGFVFGSLWDAVIGIQMTCGSVYGSFWNGNAVSILYFADTNQGSVGNYRTTSNAFRMYVDDGDQWFRCAAGSGVGSSQTAYDGKKCYPLIGSDNETGEHGAWGGGLNIDVGKVWWWDVIVMRDHRIRITGLAEDDYVRIGSDDDGWIYSLEAASGAGEADLYLNVDSSLITRYNVTTTFTRRYVMDCPITGDFEIWDGPPWETTSTRTALVDVSEVEFYGGDVWDYDSGGGYVDPGETLTDVSAVLILEFLDAGGNVISSVETDPVTTTSRDLSTRHGKQNSTIPGGTSAFRFRLEKRGTGNGHAVSLRLQFNGGTSCCNYSVPTYNTLPPNVDEYWDLYYQPDDPNTGDLSDDVALSIDEHRRGGGNLVSESRDSRSITTQTGDVNGDQYPRIVLADHGIEPGDVISIRGKAKVD